METENITILDRFCKIVLILPMRNGNGVFVAKKDSKVMEVLILPMRNGNSFSSSLLLP